MTFPVNCSFPHPYKGAPTFYVREPLIYTPDDLNCVSIDKKD